MDTNKPQGEPLINGNMVNYLAKLNINEGEILFEPLGIAAVSFFEDVDFDYNL